MKHNHWSSYLIGAVFAFLFSVCGVGCLLTGWGMHIASLNLLIFWCALFSVLTPLLLYVRHGIWVFLLLTVRGAFAIWQDGELWKQIQTFAYIISSHFRDVYNWPEIGARRSAELDLVLILLAYAIAVCVSFCICRKAHILMALIPVLVPLVLCLITTDTLPDALILGLLILGIGMLLLTDWVRRNHPAQFTGLFLRTVIPTAAALMLLFGLNPQEEYVNHAAELQKMAVTAYEKVKSAAEAITSGTITGSSTGETVNLRTMGPKSDFSFTVMRVTSPYDGVIYLRGRDYDTYTGTAWESSDERSEVFPTGSEGAGTLTVVTYGVRSIRYVPYYPTESIELTDGFSDNSGNAVVYRYSVSPTPDAYTGSVIDASDYTHLPRETHLWARKLVKEILGGKKTAGEREIVGWIGDYVRNSASYDLSTTTMSADYEDFAQWFLEASDTGYCVHFATAAAVLLRAAGIPARYVEGYMAGCRADEKTLVSNQSAHAWVEYYDSSDMVWRVLEATPAAALVPTEGVTDDAEETEAEETDPPETEPEETDPEETDAPDDTDDTDSQNEPAESEEIRSDETPDGTENTGTPQNSVSKPGTVSGNGTSDTNTGGENSGADSAEEKPPLVIPGWVKKLGKILLTILLVAAAIQVQGHLRIAYRRKKWYSGTPNEMALERRRQLSYMARLVNRRVPAELEELALKAKFSQHTLTREELYRFELFRRQILETIDGLPWYKRAFLRWIPAVG